MPASSDADRSTDMPAQLGRFRVVGVLGQGGMGTVVEAYDSSLERNVALKLLLPGTSARHAERLRREALALARLSHPNVVSVYDVGEADGRTFIAMELVRGQTLGDWQRNRPHWRECVRTYIQAGRGLAAAHAEGLIHRDFKPSNCIIDQEGRVRVLDFGLARDRQFAGIVRPVLDHAVTSSSGSSLREPLTRTGAVLGTLAYMPLEQLMGQPAKASSDQFSFCVSLYEGLYGQRPFVYDSVGKLALALEMGRVRAPPRNVRVPSRLHRVLLRGLSTRPEDRFRSMDALLAELRRVVRPRRRLWTAVALGAGGAVLALGLWQRATEAQERCSGGPALLEGIWDEPTRQRIEAAITAADLSYGAETWERASERLDAYREAWMAEHVDACEATNVRQEQSVAVMDLRMACLMRSRAALRETTRAFTTADADAVEHAVSLVSSLPRLERCADVEALRAAVAPPEDAAVAREVDQLREALAQVQVLHRMGRYGAASEALEDIAPRAAELEYGPLSAEVELHRGLLLDQHGRVEDAAPVLQQAYILAVEVGADDVAVEAARGLMGVYGSRDSKYESALQWGVTALALARRGGEREVARSTERVGSVLRRAGRLDEAIEHFRRAQELREGLPEPDHLELAYSLSALGQALSQRGDLEAAAEVLQQAITIQEEQLGPSHPNVAVTWSAIGNVAYARGQFDRAEDHQRHALDITERALGPDHPAIASPLVSLSAIMFGRETPESLEQAKGLLQRALEIQRKALGPEHRDVAIIMNNLATISIQQGKLDDALELLERALAIEEHVEGPEHLSVGQTLTNLGAVLQKLHRLDDAREHLERALPIYERALGAEHPNLAKVLGTLSIVEREQGQLSLAEDYAERSLDIVEQSLPADHPALSGFVVEHGLVLMAQGRHDEALERFRRALSLDERAFGPQHDNVARDLLHIAEVELLRGQIDEARALAERAIEMTESTDGFLHGDGRFVLARVLWHTPAERARARSLAAQAAEKFSNSEQHAPRLARVQAWLAAHPR